MAVDSLRNTFHINRVKPEEIGLLLSAQSYRPEITQAVNRIKSYAGWQPLQVICSEPIAQSQSPTYTEIGHICLKTRNVLDLIVSLDDVAYITPESAKRLERFAVKDQTILMNRSGSGSIGRVSIYLGKDSLRTNEHLFRIVVDQSCDPAYVCCFLSSWWGAREIEQGISGTTGQLNLSNEHIRLLPVPVPDYKVQKYIGDKVRQAERLRERSRRLAKLVDKYFTKFDTSERLENSRTTRISSDLMSYRLDHLHYRPDLLNSFKIINQYPIARLGDERYFENLYDGDHGNPAYGDGPIYIRASELNGNCLNELDVVRLNRHYADGISKTCWAQEGDIVFSIVGTLGLIAVLRPGQSGVMSRGVAKITPTSLPTYYVRAFMRRSAFRKELLRQSVGTVQRGVYLESLKDIPIPILDESLMSSIADIEQKSELLAVSSRLLTEAAKLLVEALINGELDESTLKSAQTSLEKNDISVDRKILASLTHRDAGKPSKIALFPDLDEFYNALEQLNDVKAIEEDLK